MSHQLIYRALVPNAPVHKRTTGDDPAAMFSFAALSLAQKAVLPGLQEPQLISSFAGSIERILLCFPYWAVEDTDFVAAYRSTIGALRVGTRFVIVHHASIGAAVAPWFSAAGHPEANLIFVSLPDYVTLTDWAEDAYVSLTDASDGSTYLMEPWEFKRVGDALIADSVEEYSDINASQAPLIFQGGNCLAGDDFWLLGKDYFVDTVELLEGQRAPVNVPFGDTVDQFVRSLFATYVEKNRKLILIGADNPIPFRQYAGAKSGNAFYLDIAAGGAGEYQPIFHIDMFITLVGKNSAGKFEILVGSPALGDKLLGTKSPYAFDSVYDAIASELVEQGFAVTRNPLVHRPTPGQQLTLGELKDIASQPGYEGIGVAITELTALGAVDSSRVRVRDWHHITWNNCLVENSVSKGKNVYLPTFAYGAYADLKPIDVEMKRMWEALGFNVHLLADFNKFAERQGVVHCIKKYLERGD